MKIATLRRLERLEEKHCAKLWKPWLVLLDPDAVPPLGWESSYGGLARVVVVEGRQPYPIYEGERLKADAWPNHLLVPMDGPRPAGEPLPYPLELIAGFDGRTPQENP